MVAMSRELIGEAAEAVATESSRPLVENDRPGDRSIVVIGDDPLMVRALDRLLRRAGYAVGIRERDLDQTNVPLPLDDLGVAALTVIDVPDSWTRHGRLPGVASRRWPERPDSVLWLSNTAGIVESSERCLVKPFTASQFLAKVEALLKQNSTER